MWKWDNKRHNGKCLFSTIRSVHFSDKFSLESFQMILVKDNPDIKVLEKKLLHIVRMEGVFCLSRLRLDLNYPYWSLLEAARSLVHKGKLHVVDGLEEAYARAD
jgi:hypothetical protein